MNSVKVPQRGIDRLVHMHANVDQANYNWVGFPARFTTVLTFALVCLLAQANRLQVIPGIECCSIRCTWFVTRGSA